MSVRRERSGVVTYILAPTQEAIVRWAMRPEVRAALTATIAFRSFCSILSAAPFLLGWAPLRSADPFGYLIYPWNHWDTVWYTSIARYGYTTYGSTFFMPLYPLLVRMTALLLGGEYVGAALLVSTVAAFFALQGLYRFAVHLDPSGGLGPLALLVALTLPTSFILMAGYTESLFLACSLWAILAALNRRWGHMALFAGLAALTRQQGVLLALLAAPATWTWLRGISQRLFSPHISAPLRLVSPVKSNAMALGAGLVPILAYGGWITVVGLILHAPLPWELLAAPDAWNLRFAWPGVGLLADVALLVHPAPDLIGMRVGAALDVSASVAAAVSLLVALRRLPSGLLLYLAAMWCTAQMKALPNGLTIAEGRYMLGLLPLCIVPARWLARGGPARRLIWVAGGTCSLVIFLLAFIFGGWTP
jgi:hypothetical protein